MYAVPGIDEMIGTFSSKWISKNERLMKYGNPNPGPGTYDSPEGRKMQGGYIGHKSLEFPSLNVPGPGSYEENATIFNQARAPSYSMRNKGVHAEMSKVPGPGQYDMSDNNYRRNFSGKIVSKAAKLGLN